MSLKHDATDTFWLEQLVQSQASRILHLEGALREIKDQYLTPDQSSAIAKAALAREQYK